MYYLILLKFRKCINIVFKLKGKLKKAKSEYIKSAEEVNKAKNSYFEYEKISSNSCKFFNKNLAFLLLMLIISRKNTRKTRNS